MPHFRAGNDNLLPPSLKAHNYGGQVAVLIEQGQVLEVMDHPDQRKHPKQKMAIVEIDGYACLVPYVDDEEGVFLKTIIPSRKATKKYLRGQK